MLAKKENYNYILVYVQFTTGYFVLGMLLFRKCFILKKLISKMGLITDTLSSQLKTILYSQ